MIDPGAIGFVLGALGLCAFVGVALAFADPLARVPTGALTLSVAAMLGAPGLMDGWAAVDGWALPVGVVVLIGEALIWHLRIDPPR